MTMIMMTENLTTKITINNLQIPICRNYEIRKGSQKYGELSYKSGEKVHFKTCQFTNEETHFISFKDLSCILRSKRIFRQYLRFPAFSILATQLTGF